jgi:hypothetical protein
MIRPIDTATVKIFLIIKLYFIMKTKMAITGFILDNHLKNLKSKEGHSFEVFPEAAMEDVYARVNANDIDDVRVGASNQGKTMVQLILKDNASVETVHKQQMSVKGVKVIDDPTLSRLTAAATAKVIMV